MFSIFYDFNFFFIFFFFVVKVIFVFLIIVLVRVTNPRLKLEGLTKITWIFIVGLVFLSLIILNLGYFLY